MATSVARAYFHLVRSWGPTPVRSTTLGHLFSSILTHFCVTSSYGGGHIWSVSLCFQTESQKWLDGLKSGCNWSSKCAVFKETLTTSSNIIILSLSFFLAYSISKMP